MALSDGLGIILKLCIFVQDRWTLRKLTGHFHFLRARARTQQRPGALITHLSLSDPALCARPLNREAEMRDRIFFLL